MTVRTTKKSVTFVNPFVLGDVDEILPPGTYDVETDEELLEGLSFPAYRRSLTLIYLPAKSSRRGLSQTLTIDPNELDAALKRDAASSTVPAEPAPVRKPSKGTPDAHEAEIDCQAMDRAEGEGMSVRPH